MVPNRYPAIELPEGAHEVIIESPEHTTRFIDLSAEGASLAIQMWARRVAYWRAERSKEYLLLFKNEGVAAGASLEHIHSQFTAIDIVPDEIHEMWCKLLDDPSAIDPAPEQLISLSKNGKFQSKTPQAPRASFESWILPAQYDLSFESLAENTDAADEMSELLKTSLELILSGAKATSFNLVLQIPPNSLAEQIGHRWWIEIAPRTASLAGFELATNWRINAVSPEQATGTLRKMFAELRADQTVSEGSDSEVLPVR